MTTNVAASIKARLLARAKSENEEFERTLVRYAAERLLYRLGVSGARERCLLKGASLLTVWLPDPYRVTRDVDLHALGPANEEAIRGLVAQICAVSCPEDGLRFDLSGLTVETIRAWEEYAGNRARFTAYLGKARIAVQMDVGSGDTVVAEHEEIELPVLVEGLPAPRLRAYRREATVAEKFEAMVNLDVRNSRMKDFHDVWALSDSLAFEGPSLRQAIVTCFDRRGTHWLREMPTVLTPAFYQLPELETRWSAYLAGGSVIVTPPGRFAHIGEQVIRFLVPMRESVLQNDPFTQVWPAGGPWRHAGGERESGV